MFDYTFECVFKTNVKNKNGIVFTDEAFESMKSQVNEKYKTGFPIPLSIDSVKENLDLYNFSTVNPENIIGYVKDLTKDNILTCISDDKKEEFEKLLQEDYEPGYRITTELSAKKEVFNVKIICFDMIRKDLKA